MILKRYKNVCKSFYSSYTHKKNPQISLIWLALDNMKQQGTNELGHPAIHRIMMEVIIRIWISWLAILPFHFQTKRLHTWFVLHTRFSLSICPRSCCVGLFTMAVDVIDCHHSLSGALESTHEGRWIQVEEDRRDIPDHCHHSVAPPRQKIGSCFAAWEEIVQKFSFSFSWLKYCEVTHEEQQVTPWSLVDQCSKKKKKNAIKMNR